MTHMLMHHGGVAKVMTTYQVFATYYAALIHDFEHLGVNNDYLIKTFHPLAVMYNDQSPLENHHIAAAVRLMLRPECNFTGVTSTIQPHIACCECQCMLLHFLGLSCLVSTFIHPCLPDSALFQQTTR